MQSSFPFITTHRHKCDHCGGSLKVAVYTDADTGKRFCSSYCIMVFATSDRGNHRQLEFDFPDVMHHTVLPSTS